MRNIIWALILGMAHAGKNENRKCRASDMSKRWRWSSWRDENSALCTRWMLDRSCSLKPRSVRLNKINENYKLIFSKGLSFIRVRLVYSIFIKVH